MGEKSPERPGNTKIDMVVMMLMMKYTRFGTPSNVAKKRRMRRREEKKVRRGDEPSRSIIHA